MAGALDIADGGRGAPGRMGLIDAGASVVENVDCAELGLSGKP